MANLIDKSALVAKIERLIRHSQEAKLEWIDEGYNQNAFAEDCRIISLKKLLSFIDTPEVKEVDLNEEIEKCLKRHSMLAVGKKDFTNIAKHFFELGLQARTDKELVEEIYSHINSIKETADRMTSGNFMHNKAAIKFSANTIAKVLELMGLKAQKGE